MDAVYGEYFTRLSSGKGRELRNFGGYWREGIRVYEGREIFV